VDEAECWPVAPGEQWHGFNDADADHMFLDPVKVTILSLSPSYILASAH